MSAGPVENSTFPIHSKIGNAAFQMRRIYSKGWNIWERRKPWRGMTSKKRLKGVETERVSLLMEGRERENWTKRRETNGGMELKRRLLFTVHLITIWPCWLPEPFLSAKPTLSHTRCIDKIQEKKKSMFFSLFFFLVVPHVRDEYEQIIFC